MIRTAILILISFLLAGAAALAQPARDEFTGALVDANCTHANGGPDACAPGVNTFAFGLVINGKAYLLDNTGNAKAWYAVRELQRLHDSDPHYPYPKPLTASITGWQAGHEIVVKTFMIR